MQKEAFNETIPNPEAIQVLEKYLRKNKKLKRIMSHEATSLEYKQAAQDESVQW